MAYSKPVQGQKFGCTDTAPPEDHTEAQLSRVYDVLYTLQQSDVGVSPDQFWATLPRGIRMDFIYSRWTYQAL